MAITSLQASRIICELKQWSVSNLVLQKILYISQGMFMADKGGYEKILITADFHAWSYGPVVVDLYHKVKVFGAGAIDEEFLTTEDKIDATGEEYKHIQKIVNLLCDATPSQLVTLTHASGGAWEQCYKPGMSILIEKKYIYDEYREN